MIRYVVLAVLLSGCGVSPSSPDQPPRSMLTSSMNPLCILGCRVQIDADNQEPTSIGELNGSFAPVYSPQGAVTTEGSRSTSLTQ